MTKVVHRAHLVAHLHLPESIDVNRLSLSLSRDGKYAVVGGPNDSSYVLRLTAEALAEHVGKKAHGEEQSEIPAAEKAVEILRKRWPGHEVTSGVEFSPDGRLLLSMHWGGVRVWEVSTGKVMYELEGWLGRFTMDGKHIITSAGADKNGNCLRLYDAHNGKLLRSFGKSPRAFWSLTMSADGRFVITNGDDNIGRLWDLKTGALVKSTPKDDLRPHNWDGPDVPAFQKRTGIGPIYLLPGGRQVLGSKPGDDQYGIYDLESGRLVRKLAASWKGLYGAASNYGCPLGYRMAFSYADGTICVLDLRSGKEVARFASGIFSPKCLAISADDRFVAACAGNEKSEVVVWRLPEPSQQVAKVRKMANGDDPEESESPADQPSWADKLFLAKGSTSHDFGTVAAGTQLKHRFRLKNIYSVPVEITSIRTSAGSAITCKESTRILKPNEEGYIDIKLDGRCFRGLKTVTIYVSVGPHYVSQARLQVTALAQEEADFSPESAFFNGKNLFGWQGLPGYWKVHNGAIVGAPADGIKRHTFLCSEKTYRDFELKFKVKRKGGIGNSGVQIRSTLVCAKQFVVTGPQIEIDSANHRFPPGSILIEPTGNPHIKANAAAVADVWKDEGFNDMTIRCEGKWVTVTINGVQVLDAPFPSMPAEGIIAWQLHGGTNGIVAPDEVIFKDIQFRELNKDQVRGPTPAEKKLVRHHFLDSSNWHGLKQFWTIKGGEIKGASDLEQPKDNTFLCSRRTYKDFELRFQVRVTGQGWAGNSGVQIRSTLIEPEKFIVRGPQCDIGESYWGCLYGERSGGMIKQASWEIGDRNVKEGQFNDYYIRCVGKHVTIKVNGLTTVDDKFPQLPEEGIIAWQLHGGKSMSVTFRNIEFKELVRPHTLFNGDMTGWIKEGGYPRTWQTENGELIGTATGYLKSGFILSPKSYTNFRLRFQYQLSAAANSGVALRAAPGEKEGQSQVPLHLEVQLLDDGAYLKPDGRMDCFTGALYWCTRGNTSLPPKHRAHFKAAGSWNEMEIELRGQRLQVWVNGRLVQDTDLDDLAFRADALPGLKRTAGRIGFQQHTGQVRFRNIQIEELSGPDASSTSTSGYRGVQVTPPDAVRLPRKSC